MILISQLRGLRGLKIRVHWLEILLLRILNWKIIQILLHLRISILLICKWLIRILISLSKCILLTIINSIILRLVKALYMYLWYWLLSHRPLIIVLLRYNRVDLLLLRKSSGVKCISFWHWINTKFPHVNITDIRDITKILLILLHELLLMPIIEHINDILILNKLSVGIKEQFILSSKCSIQGILKLSSSSCLINIYSTCMIPKRHLSMILKAFKIFDLWGWASTRQRIRGTILKFLLDLSVIRSKCSILNLKWTKRVYLIV